MASSRESFFAAFFLLLACLAASAVCLDQFDCKEVECPPEITCPDDSSLRVTYSKFDYDTRNSIYGDKSDTINDKTDQPRRHTSRFMVETSDTINDHPKSLQKRSLQYRRRESIKIVPGDYISLVPEAVRYHQQMHQHQHKWKRTADELQTNIIDICCPKQTCVCSGNCELPKCFNPAQVPYQRVPGSDVPGKCCPLYQCIDEPNCSTANDTVNFWPTKCKKCMCLSGQKICHQECDETATCFSKNLSKSFLNGISWLEDDCTQCQCDNGETRCHTSFCKPLDCTNKIKIKGECCQVCVTDNKTETTTMPVTKMTEPAILPNTTVDKSSKDIDENGTTTFTTLPDDDINIYESTTLKATSQTNPTPTKVTSVSTVTSSSSTDTSKTTNHQLSSSTVEVVSTTSSSMFLSSSSTPKVVPSTATVANEGPSKNVSTIVGATSTILPVLALTERFSYFNTETESIILYIVIVVLLIICCVFAGLYIHEVTKRQSYSSIPNSDSNLSQMPRPKVEESA